MIKKILQFIIAAIMMTSDIAYADLSRWKEWNKGWYSAIYLGQLTDSHLWQFFILETNFKPSYMITLAAGKEIWRFQDKFSFELEGQLTKYFGGYTFECNTEDCIKLPEEQRHGIEQNHTEINFLTALRWLKFPWDNYLDTSFALGEGLSYADTVPAVENDAHNELFNVESSTPKLLNYLMLELNFALPYQPSWSIFTRIHHRSGVFGLFNGSTSGSNTLAIGTRYDF